MHIEKFDKSHIKAILKLLSSKDMTSKMVDELPKLGYVAFHDDFLIGAGFIRMCEGSIGIFDSYITNPVAPAKLRNEGIRLITTKLMNDSKVLELKGLLVFSRDCSIIDRSLEYGFVKSDQTLLIRKL